MKTIFLLSLATSFSLHISPATAAVPFYVPFYGTTANDFTSAARGWNTFGLQAATPKLRADSNFVFNDAGIRSQCKLIQTQPGFDYVCSIDSGWSVDCNGDENGLMEVKTEVIPDIKNLADYIHGLGLKFGLYILPGTFIADAEKYVMGTNIQIGSLFDDKYKPYNCRRAFDFSKDGVQQWHDSLIAKFASWGVDFIKLDYLTPGSPDNGNPDGLPADSSGTAIAYHKAIQKLGVKMRLDISWKLNRTEPYWSIWKSTSDSIRVDQDLNNYGKDNFTTWWTVLRTIDYYRQFINENTVPARYNAPIMIRPDLDNSFIGNAADIAGLTDAQRVTMAAHWISSGAKLITGSDLTRLDTIGQELLYGNNTLEAAAFSAQYPMQPRNPSQTPNPGSNQARQLQTWIAGPDKSGNTAYVILTNYGPDPCIVTRGLCAPGPTYRATNPGVRLVSIKLDQLGIAGSKWNAKLIWRAGSVFEGSTKALGLRLEDHLGPGESAYFKLTKA